MTDDLLPPTEIDGNRHPKGHITAQVGTTPGTVPARRGRKTEAQRTAELLLSLPEGISIGHYKDGRKKPFFVRFGAARKVESFVHECDRNDAADKLASQRDTQGSAILSFDPEQWRAYLRFRERCPAEFDELERLWKASRRVVMNVGQAIERYKALRLAEGLKEKSDTYRHIKLHLKRLKTKLGGLLLTDLTVDLLRDFFATLVDPDTGKPMDPVTVRNHRKDVNTFLSRAVDEEWCDKNPCKKVKPPKVGAKDKPPMPVRDIFQLLKANVNEPVVGRIALELFASMRFSSAARCQESWIKWEARAIRMPGTDIETGEHLHKSGKSKFRQGHPTVLWEWLKHASPQCWTGVSVSSYGHKKTDAFIRAGVINPGNGLRRSCASYQLALTKNVGPVSYLMQHTKTSTTEIYEGMADERDAKLFMAMSPSAVLLTWEEFVKKAT